MNGHTLMRWFGHAVHIMKQCASVEAIQPEQSACLMMDKVIVALPCLAVVVVIEMKNH
jgi:hypothetical protein